MHVPYTIVIACSLNSLVKDFCNFFFLVATSTTSLSSSTHSIAGDHDVFGRLSVVRLRGSAAIDFALGPRRTLAFVEDDIISQCIVHVSVCSTDLTMYRSTSEACCHPSILRSDINCNSSALARPMSYKATWAVIH